MFNVTCGTVSTSWLWYKPELVLEYETQEILTDFDLPIDPQLPARKTRPSDN